MEQNLTAKSDILVGVDAKGDLCLILGSGERVNLTQTEAKALAKAILRAASARRRRNGTKKDATE